MDIVDRHNPFYGITDDYSRIILYAEDDAGNIQTVEWTPEQVRDHLDTDTARAVIEEAIRFGRADVHTDEDNQRVVFDSHIDGLAAEFPFTYEYRDTRADETVGDDIKRNNAGQVLARVNVSTSGLLKVDDKNAFEVEGGRPYKGACRVAKSSVETAGLF